MPKGKTKEHATHDRKVGKIAREYEKKGYKVYDAATSKRPKPTPIGRSGRIPDVVAKKGGRTKIVEVETPKSLKADKTQLQTFARYAARRKNVSFDIVVTKPRKRASTTTGSTGGKASKKR